MPEEKSISLINLSKAAEVLIEKISSAIGVIFEPHQIKRVAKAQAEADLIKAQADIRITVLHRRAMRRLLEEEAKHQENIERITSKAIPQLTEGSKPHAIDNDWITNFFAKARIVSDQDIQILWSRVLAEEANAPGSYSKRTVNFLADLDKDDAQMFTALCGYTWTFDDFLSPLVFDTDAEIYKARGLTFNMLMHLDAIGLIHYNGDDLVLLHLPKHLTASYYGQSLALELKKDSDNTLALGFVGFTRMGHELAPISGSKPVDGYLEYVKKIWAPYSPSPVDSGSPDPHN